MMLPATSVRSVQPRKLVWRYDPVAARSVVAVLFLAAGSIGLGSAALPGWPGGRPAIIAALSMLALTCGMVLRRLPQVPYRLALALTGSGNVMIAAAQYVGGRDGAAAAYAALYALALAAAFLFYTLRAVAAQVALAVAAQSAVLYLIGAGRTAPATVVVTIGSACATGWVVRTMAGLRAQAEQELAWQASHDSLTELPNRLDLVRRWKQALAAEAHVSVLVLDLRGFKKINDEHGHHFGDAVLVEVGRRLSTLGDPATAVRLGGDEFAVLLPGVERDEATRWAVDVSALLQEGSYQVGTVELPLCATVGVATYRRECLTRPSRADTAEEDVRALSAVLAEADAAMYHARRLGRAVAARDEAPSSPAMAGHAA